MTPKEIFTAAKALGMDLEQYLILAAISAGEVSSTSDIVSLGVPERTAKRKLAALRGLGLFHGFKIHNSVMRESGTTKGAKMALFGGAKMALPRNGEGQNGPFQKFGANLALLENGEGQNGPFRGCQNGPFLDKGAKMALFGGAKMALLPDEADDQRSVDFSGFLDAIICTCAHPHPRKNGRENNILYYNTNSSDMDMGKTKDTFLGRVGSGRGAGEGEGRDPFLDGFGSIPHGTVGGAIPQLIVEPEKQKNKTVGASNFHHILKPALGELSTEVGTEGGAASENFHTFIEVNGTEETSSNGGSILPSEPHSGGYADATSCEGQKWPAIDSESPGSVNTLLEEISQPGANKVAITRSEKEIEEEGLVIDCLRRISGRAFRAGTKLTGSLRARIQEYGVDAVLAVTATKASEWYLSPEMKKYLTPETLYRPGNFEKYLANADGALIDGRFNPEAIPELVGKNPFSPNENEPVHGSIRRMMRNAFGASKPEEIDGRVHPAISSPQPAVFLPCLHSIRSFRISNSEIDSFFQEYAPNNNFELFSYAIKRLAQDLSWSRHRNVFHEIRRTKPAEWASAMSSGRLK